MRTNRTRGSFLRWAILGLSLLVVALASADPGDPDRTFAGDGKAVTKFRNQYGADARAVAIGSQGRITAVGDVGGGAKFGIARLMPGGGRDRTFSGNGRLESRFGGGSGSASDVELGREGQIVIAGGARKKARGPYGFKLVQLKRGGALDRSFGAGGARYVFFGSSDGISDIEIDRRGRIVAVGGGTTPRGGAAFAIARFTAGGNLDRSFSRDGRLILRADGRGSEAAAVDIDPSGRIVVGGSVFGRANPAFAVARLRPGGAIDRTFSRDGFVTNPSAGPCEVRCPQGLADLEVDRQGRIVAAGGVTAVRYRPGGALDRTFNRDGIFRNDYFGASGLAIDHRGRVVLAGNTGGFLPIAFAAIRLTRRGFVDDDFFVDDAEFSSAHDVAIDRAGRVVVVGRSGGRTSGFAYARYRSD